MTTLTTMTTKATTTMETKTNKVITLPGCDDVVRAEPNEQLVQQLERHLEEAKAGELRGMSYALAYKNTSGGGLIVEGPSDIVALLGESQVMIHRMTRSLIELDEAE